MEKRPGQTVKAAGILLIARDVDQTYFLLMRHPKRWDLPKGHCEEGETFRQTALRETEEETGIPASAIELDSEFVFDLRYQVTYKRFGDMLFDKHVRYFVGYLSERPLLTLTEHESAEWFVWNPPHPTIQPETIDPLLVAVADHLQC